VRTSARERGGDQVQKIAPQVKRSRACPRRGPPQKRRGNSGVGKKRDSVPKKKLPRRKSQPINRGGGGGGGGEGEVRKKKRNGSARKTTAKGEGERAKQGRPSE